MIANASDLIASLIISLIIHRRAVAIDEYIHFDGTRMENVLNGELYEEWEEEMRHLMAAYSNEKLSNDRLLYCPLAHQFMQVGIERAEQCIDTALQSESDSIDSLLYNWSDFTKPCWK